MLDDFRPPPLREAGIRIREALPSDIGDLARLEESAFVSDRLTRRRFAALAKSPTATLLVARCGAALAGYCLLLTRRGSRAARLYSIAVAPDMGRRGIGARLLDAAEAAAAARGAHHLRLEVRGDNAAAIRLYEQRGYAATGRSENYYQDGAPALRYARALSRAALGRAA